MLDWVCTEEWLPLPPHPALIPFPRAASRGLVTTTYKVVTPKGASGSCHLYMQLAPTRGGNVTTLPPIHANVATGKGGGVGRPPPLHAACQQARKARRTCAAYTCACPSRMRAEGGVGASPPIHATPRQDRKSGSNEGRRKEVQGNPKSYLVLHPLRSEEAGINLYLKRPRLSDS